MMSGVMSFGHFPEPTYSKGAMLSCNQVHPATTPTWKGSSSLDLLITFAPEKLEMKWRCLEDVLSGRMGVIGNEIRLCNGPILLGSLPTVPHG